MVFAISCIVALAVFGYLIFMRPSHLPAPEAVSPFQHLDERKAAIYENLRDLQFEYRVGKLSDQDYQQTKLDLQKELAGVLTEVDRIRGTLPGPELQAVAPGAEKDAGATAEKGSSSPYICASCGARFAQMQKFCGECGKPMKARA